jgi:hypothetical protein
VCSFCARLNQRCTWSDGSPETQNQIPPQPHATSATSIFSSTEASLAARVALLESKLSLLGSDTGPRVFASQRRSSASRPYHALVPVNISDVNDLAHHNPAATDSVAFASQGDFSTLPNGEILLSLIDTYFTYCHNQPYTYFHEASFRRCFEEGLLPTYLLYAFAATASRFSEHDFYKGRQAEAIATYSNASWVEVFEHSFSYDDSLEFHMVQATNMLAAIDFTGEFPQAEAYRSF